MGRHSEAELDRKFIETAKLLNIYLNHFPKFEKYALCQQIRQSLYGVYALIIEGQKRYHKKTTLTNLDIQHEQLRMLINLANELGYFEFKDGKGTSDPSTAERRYLAISLLIDELGRMIGGWIKSARLGDAS